MFAPVLGELGVSTYSGSIACSHGVVGVALGLDVALSELAVVVGLDEELGVGLPPVPPVASGADVAVVASPPAVVAGASVVSSLPESSPPQALPSSSPAATSAASVLERRMVIPPRNCSRWLVGWTARSHQRPRGFAPAGRAGAAPVARRRRRRQR